MSQTKSPTYSGNRYLAAAGLTALILALPVLMAWCSGPVSPDQPPRPTATAQSVLVLPTTLPTPPPTMVPMVIVPTVRATTTPAPPTPTSAPTLEATPVPVETVPMTVTPMLRPPPTVEGQHVAAPAQVP